MTNNDNKEEKPLSLFDETPEEGVSYIKPTSIEIKLDVHKRQICRDIVQEIVRFGINQRMLLYVINLLTLNLENRDLMLALIKVINEFREQVPVARIIIDDNNQS